MLEVVEDEQCPLDPRVAHGVDDVGTPGSTARTDRVGDGRQDVAEWSTTELSGTNTTPPGKSSAMVRAVSRASRVLPMPPAPVTVTSRVPGSRSAALPATRRQSPGPGIAPGETGIRWCRFRRSQRGVPRGQPGDVELEQRVWAAGSP